MFKFKFDRKSFLFFNSIRKMSRIFQIQTDNRRFKPFDSGIHIKCLFVMKRRLFLILEKEKQWQGPFCFVQAADCQPGLSDRWNGEHRQACTPETKMKWVIRWSIEENN